MSFDEVLDLTGGVFYFIRSNIFGTIIEVQIYGSIVYAGYVDKQTKTISIG